MKKVIFVCLLTLSVCLSQPANVESTTKSQTAASAANTKPAEKDVSSMQPTQPTPPLTTQATNGKEHDNKSPGQPIVPAADGKKGTTPAPPADVTTKNGNTITGEPDNSTITTTTTTTSTTVKPDNGTASEAPVPKSSPPTPNNVVTSTTLRPTLQARGFDGASFVGGIILTLGLIAIGFMGLKYYRAQTERNYHTL